MFGFFNNDDKLSDACITNNIAIVAKLLKDGAEINDPNRDGRTPLMEACQRNHFECVQFFWYGAVIQKHLKASIINYLFYGESYEFRI